MTKRYTLTNTSIAGQWRCCDYELMLACTFQKHQFNDTQNFDTSEAVIKDPKLLAIAVTDMASWLVENHYNVAFEPLDAEQLNRALLGRKIKDLRLAMGLSQVDLAERTGLVKTAISRIENGGANTTVDILNRIADALNCKLTLINKE